MSTILNHGDIVHCESNDRKGIITGIFFDKNRRSSILVESEDVSFLTTCDDITKRIQKGSQISLITSEKPHLRGLGKMFENLESVEVDRDLDEE